MYQGEITDAKLSSLLGGNYHDSRQQSPQLSW